MNRLFPLLGLVVLSAGCEVASRRVELTAIRDSLDPLKERFNAAKDHPRVVAILSPV